MRFVCHSKILHEHCFKFLLGVKMAPRETENNAYAKFGVTNKERYGMLWYFLEWSMKLVQNVTSTLIPSTKEENFVGINKDKRFRNRDNKNLPRQ